LRTKAIDIQRAAQQINGREGETATFLSTGLFTLTLRGGGFAPRHLKRWAFLERNFNSGLNN